MKWKFITKSIILPEDLKSFKKNRLESGDTFCAQKSSNAMEILLCIEKRRSINTDKSIDLLAVLFIDTVYRYRDKKPFNADYKDSQVCNQLEFIVAAINAGFTVQESIFLIYSYSQGVSTKDYFLKYHINYSTPDFRNLMNGSKKLLYCDID